MIFLHKWPTAMYPSRPKGSNVQSQHRNSPEHRDKGKKKNPSGGREDVLVGCSQVYKPGEKKRSGALALRVSLYEAE